MQNLQPLGNSVSNSKITIDSPLPQPSQSPVKHQSPHSSPNLEVKESLFDSVRFPPPDTSFPTDSPSKRSAFAPYYEYQTLAQKPQEAFFTTFNTATAGHGETAVRSSTFYPAPPKSGKPFGLQAVQGKRLGTANMPLKNTRTKESRPEEDFAGPSLDPNDTLPEIRDDGLKPPYSYAQIIFLAISRSPNRRLTLSQIYKWISDTFVFYRELNENGNAGWMNSIRHNLSLSQYFVKKERPKEDAGKGNYWALSEGAEQHFMHEISTRRTDPDVGFFKTLRSDKAKASRNWNGYRKQSGPMKTVDSSKFPGDSEPSSDATIPDPAAAAQEPQIPRDNAMSKPAPARSSPPLDLNSSPPVARRGAPKADLSPRMPAPPAPNGAGGRKRQFDSFRDSGYYSSVESSVPRGDGREPKRIRGGQAQDEIRRMRSSSLDISPARNRPAIKKATRSSNLGSSPLRQSPERSMGEDSPESLQVFPAIPPPRVESPNTHLRRHRESVRELMGTPAEALASHQDTNWTPEFAIDDCDAYSSPKTGSVGKTLAASDFLTLRTPQMPSSSSKPSDSASSNWSIFDPENPIFDSFTRGSPMTKKPATNKNKQSSAKLETGVLPSLASPFGSPTRMSPPKRSGSRDVSPHKKFRNPGNNPFLGYDEAAVEMAKKSCNRSVEHDLALGLLPCKPMGMDIMRGFRPISGVKSNKENVPSTAEHTREKAKMKPASGHFGGVRNNRAPLQKRPVY